MPDEVFDNPKLASVYDELDPDRSDLDHYEAIMHELAATSVLDVGCGIGELAIRLARRGLVVTGVDPAGASLDVARAKDGGDRVTWLLGDATSLPPMSVDAAVMTGNVAQVFLTDESWLATLQGVHRALVAGGHLVFESRVPSRRAWEQRTREHSAEVVPTHLGLVEQWVELTEVALPLVSFRATNVFEDGDVLTSDSTLRFRERAEIESSLEHAAFDVVDVRDAPDRPGREFVFIARAR